MAIPEFTTEELESEEWRTIKKYPAYSISNLGRVRRGPRILRTRYTKQYPAVRVSLGSRGKQYTPFIHPLVAEAFLGPRPQGKVVNHRDGDKINTRVSNLEYVTPSENFRHALRLGLMNRPRRYCDIIKSLHGAGVSFQVIKDAFQIPQRRLRFYLRS